MVPILPLIVGERSIAYTINISHLRWNFLAEIECISELCENIRSKSLGQDVSKLEPGWYIKKSNLPSRLKFTNQMIKHINMLGPLVKFGILHQANRKLIIGKQRSRVGLWKP